MNKVIIKYSVFFLLLCAFAVSHSALKIIIKKVPGNIKLAIVPFKVTGSASQDVSAIINADLSMTGKFNIFDGSSLPSKPSTVAGVSSSAWGRFQNVVIGNVINSGGKYTITAKLLTSTGSVSVKRTINKTASRSSLRLAAHQVANAIFKELVGIPGVFDTKIAYISSVKNNRGRRITTLITADFDGHNPIVQRSSKNPLMSPTWSPDGRKLAYVLFKSNGRSSIYIQDVRTKRRTLISSFKGINDGAPSFSPDGSRLSLTLSRRGNPEIYTFNLRTKKLKRLTFNTAIDTEAVWTRDGRSLVFTSDRTGGPQLYKVSASGGRATRLSRNGNYNSRASYSADGKKITMVHRYEGKFNIGVMDLNKSNTIRSITTGRLDESPSFAPNGSMVIYASEYNRRGVLWIVSEDGKAKNRVVLPEGDIREPAWGPKRR